MDMKITVLGGGAIGLATSMDLSLKGYEVRLFELPEFEDPILPIIEKGGVDYTGINGSGFAKINTITTDIEEAVNGSHLIMLAAPAFSHKKFMEACIPHLQDGQVFLIETGYFGSLKFTEIIKDTKKDLLIGEMNLTPYGSTREGPTEIYIHVSREEIYIAAMLSIRTLELLDLVKGIYPGAIPAKNVIQTSLDNANWVMHAPFALPFRGIFENNEEYTLRIKDTIIPCTTRLTEEMGDEQQRLAAAFNVDVPPLEHIFEPGENYEEAIRKSPEYKTWKLKYKNGMNTYMTEDLYCALPLISQLAGIAGAEMPTLNAFLHLFPIIDKIDYMADGVNLKDIGIDGMGLEEIDVFLEKGIKSG